MNECRPTFIAAHIHMYTHVYIHTHMYGHGHVCVSMVYCVENSVSIKLGTLHHHFKIFYSFKIPAIIGIKCRNFIPVSSLPELLR